MPWRAAVRPKPVRVSSDEVLGVAGGVDGAALGGAGAAGAGSGGLGAGAGAGAATTVVSLAAGTAVGRSIVPGSSARRWTRSSKDIERECVATLCSR